MIEWLLRNAPTMLALLDSDLACHHLSRGWRARLGLLNADDEQRLSISELFLPDGSVSLEEKLRESLVKDKSLQDIPVSLRGENGITQGLMSAWPIRLETGSAGICLAATCNTDLHRALDEVIKRFGGLDMLILNAGMFPGGRRIAELSDEQWRSVMAINLDANLSIFRVR